MLKEWEKLHSAWGDTWVWVAFDEASAGRYDLFIGGYAGTVYWIHSFSGLRSQSSRLTEACHSL